ncbi:hypothetical protein T440DRAFT_249255 [Plenodomus tracheiphilus IPT5]|uniref:Uncharacterized protein n=1 Tax=Plenodomus tracheiphilus IPT5 TaxID=1408161 RepID=A0A6A7ASC4_9PLEO|nr:hypothetical protein T440DRAFT_249255 [Plenodomus tracheiphilus IPT5]
MRGSGIATVSRTLCIVHHNAGIIPPQPQLTADRCCQSYVRIECVDHVYFTRFTRTRQSLCNIFKQSRGASMARCNHRCGPTAVVQSPHSGRHVAQYKSRAEFRSLLCTMDTPASNNRMQEITGTRCALHSPKSRLPTDDDDDDNPSGTAEESLVQEWRRAIGT